MRVNQIQNLTWAANVLVLGGLVWVGLNFWQVKKAKAEAAAEWPKAGKTDEIRPRWPGELSKFSDIHQTPIGGKVPPPPVKAVEEVKRDRTSEFKAKFKYLGAIEHLTHPERSSIRVSYDGKEMSVSPGGEVGGFQLLRVELETAKDAQGAVMTTPKLTFRNPDTGDHVPISAPPIPGAPLTDNKVAPWTPQPTSDIHRGKVSENGKLEATPYVEPGTGDVIIPYESQDWLHEFGEKNLLGQLGTVPEVDKDGKAHGLRIRTAPGQGTPLGTSSGVFPDDVLVSINGVVIASKEDVLLYLRGDGKGLERYEVVLLRQGQEKKVVYRVPSRVGVAPRD